MRVSVFDPHPVVHKALTHLLPGNGFSVVSLAYDGRNAMEQVHQAQSDIVITEIRMPHLDGLKLLELFQQEDVLSLVYSSDTNPTYIARAVANGALDYVLKTEPINHLINALQVMAGQAKVVLPERDSQFSDIRNQMSATSITRGSQHGLTNRESQVLRHLGFGLSNREVACSLKISVETVKEHVQNILRKLDCKDRTAAAVWAVREGIS